MRFPIRRLFGAALLLGALLAAVTPAVPVPNAPPPPTSGVIEVGRYGVTPGTDFAAPLRAIIDNLTGPAVLEQADSTEG